MLARGVQDVKESNGDFLLFVGDFPRRFAPGVSITLFAQVRDSASRGGYAVAAGTRGLLAPCKKLKKPKARLEAANGF
jgi:hypothetical protein